MLSSLKNLQTFDYSKPTTSTTAASSVKEKVLTKIENNISYLEKYPEYGLDFSKIPTTGSGKAEKKICSPIWDEFGETLGWTLMVSRTRVFVDSSMVHGKNDFSPYRFSDAKDLLNQLKAVSKELRTFPSSEFKVYAYIKKPVLDSDNNWKLDSKGKKMRESTYKLATISDDDLW
jgi:hypothetical protein